MNNKVSALKISRILHAGYIMECEGTTIAFDPIFETPFSFNCYAFPSVRFDYKQIRALKLDAIFISHYHDDHCSFESLKFLGRATPIYMYCIHSEMFELLRLLGFEKVHALSLGGSISIGSIEVRPLRALDEEVDCLFQICAGGLNVLNVVDSWINDSMMFHLTQFAPWDVVLWPFQTMRELAVLSPSRAERAAQHLPSEWLKQLTQLNPRYIVPSSCQFQFEEWSWYNKVFFPISYEQLEREISELLGSGKVLRMDPGSSFAFTPATFNRLARLEYVQLQTEEVVDYKFDANFQAPTTGQITQNLPALGEEEMFEVRKYCQEGIIKRFSELKTKSSYFRADRYWHLRVHREDGKVFEFNYQFDLQGNLRLTTDLQDPCWLTEIPMAKLFGALKNGESLTSIYVRINDCAFSPELERELEDVELVEDPLIASLFTAQFGSYQLAQLRRIRDSE